MRIDDVIDKLNAFTAEGDDDAFRVDEILTGFNDLEERHRALGQMGGCQRRLGSSSRSSEPSRHGPFVRRGFAAFPYRGLLVSSLIHEAVLRDLPRRICTQRTTCTVEHRTQRRVAHQL